MQSSVHAGWVVLPFAELLLSIALIPGLGRWCTWQTVAEMTPAPEPLFNNA
jgi:hypothetical protein